MEFINFSAICMACVSIAGKFVIILLDMSTFAAFSRQYSNGAMDVFFSRYKHESNSIIFIRTCETESERISIYLSVCARRVMTCVR